MRSNRTFVFATGAAALLAVAACGTSSPSASSGSSGSTSGSSGSTAGSSAPTLTIVSPAAGASVTAPFMLKVNSDETLGAPSTGADHVHLFIDGATSYTVMTADQMKLTGLKPGKHTIMVTLQHADHTAVGPKATVTVNVTGSSGSSSNTGSGGSSGGGGYGY